MKLVLGFSLLNFCFDLQPFQSLFREGYFISRYGHSSDDAYTQRLRLVPGWVALGYYVYYSCLAYIPSSTGDMKKSILNANVGEGALRSGDRCASEVLASWSWPVSTAGITSGVRGLVIVLVLLHGSSAP